MLSISERVNRRLPTVLKGKLHSLAPSDDSGSPSLALDYRHLRADREAAMAEKVRLGRHPMGVTRHQHSQVTKTRRGLLSRRALLRFL
jgi:hypothetical protein